MLRISLPTRLALIGIFTVITAGHVFAETVSSSPTISPCGLLALKVTPTGAGTWLNGRWLDNGIWLMALPAGTHHLEVRKQGFTPYFKELDVEPGQRLSLDIQLRSEESP